MDIDHEATNQVQGFQEICDEGKPNEYSPYIIAWNSFVENIDWEKTAVTIWLFLFCFLLLSPDIWNWGIWQGRKRCEKGERIQVHPGTPFVIKQQTQAVKDDKEGSLWASTSSNTTLCTGVIDEEEETEEEFFEKQYGTIQTSPYRRLVLPPECKRIDKSNVMTQTKLKMKELPKREEYDDDHPLKRLDYYILNFFSLLRSILSFDYTNTVRTVANWFQMILKMRSKQRSECDEPDDDDDTSMASAVTFKSITPSYTADDEKKKVGMTFKSASSVHEDTMTLSHPGDVDAGDVCSKVILRQRTSTGNTKSRDALHAYRTTLPFIGRPPISPRGTSITLPEPYSVHFVDHVSPLRRAVQRETSSDGMSYFDAAHSNESLTRLNVEVPVPDRNGYIVGDEFLASNDVTPLLVFVNSRSGPQQGQLLITQLRRLLNPIQIWDLADGGPEKVLQSFCIMTRLRILVCGGDGTVSWIISALERMMLPRNPPIAILPLGTGNDLARMHGWGGGYNNESLISILEQVAESYISLLDRWEMKVENKKGKVKETKSFFNYLGVGVDAQAALQVHMLRESRPKLFFSRVVNKAWYAIFGAEDAIKASHANLPNEIVLIADGVEVPLPEDSQGIILLNIDSYAGGVPMWGLGTKAEIKSELRPHSSLEHFLLHPRNGYGPKRVQSFDSIHARGSLEDALERKGSMDDLLSAGLQETDDEKLARVTACNMPSSCQDGVLDIVSVRGPIHLGQIRVGLSNAQRLCQCREATIFVKKKKVAVQVDGEPWRQGSGTIRVSRKKDPAVMLHRSPDESGGVEMEMAKLLDWAEERKIIDRSAHATMMKEFSRRIESKTRQRRVKSQDNLMQSLKRAISTRNMSSTSSGPSTFSGNLDF